MCDLKLLFLFVSYKNLKTDRWIIICLDSLREDVKKSYMWKFSRNCNVNFLFFFYDLIIRKNIFFCFFLLLYKLPIAKLRKLWLTYPPTPFEKLFPLFWMHEPAGPLWLFYPSLECMGQGLIIRICEFCLNFRSANFKNIFAVLFFFYMFRR